MKIDNLKKVYWKFEGFVSNLKLKPESEVYALCSKLKTDHEFYNICHRAKQEVEQLAINQNKEIIKSYQKKFVRYSDALESWKNNELEEKFKINQINISLMPIRGVEYELNYYYAEFYLDQNTITQNKITRFRFFKQSILFNHIDHTLKTFCDFLNPLVTLNRLKYYDYFFNNIDFESFLKPKDVKEQLNLFN